MAEDDALKGEGEHQPHDARVVVWDVPPTIECGRTFSVRVGVTCSSGCRSHGWTVEVRDHNGNLRASAITGSEPWPDTAGLHYAHVVLDAPHKEGLYAWEVRAPVNGPDVPHRVGVCRLGVRTVPTPQLLLTVVAVDAETQTPVEGAKVVVHPYKTSTDEHGVAKMKVPNGNYRLFVSGKRYVPFRSDCDVKADVTIRADLVVDRELSDADVWF